MCSTGIGVSPLEAIRPETKTDGGSGSARRPTEYLMAISQEDTAEKSTSFALSTMISRTSGARRSGAIRIHKKTHVSISTLTRRHLRRRRANPRATVR